MVIIKIIKELILMNKISIKLVGLTIAILSLNASAEPNIISVEVKAGIVQFATKQVNAAPASCVFNDNTHLWSIDNKSTSGKSMYLMLLAATSQQLAIKVKGTGDCKLIPGVERAKSIELLSE